MSNLRPESRIKSLEKRATDIEAAIEELSSDQAEELKAIRQDIKQLSEHVDLCFDQAHSYIQELVEKRLDRMETDIRSIKDDMSEMKNLMKNLMKQLLQQKSGE